MEGIELWWIGAAAEGRMLDGARVHVERAFGRPVAVRPNAARPEGTFDPRRGQHEAARILRWLGQRLPRSGTKVLAVTDADLFMPVLTFVYGEAQLGGAAAVVSVARLSGAARADPSRLRERLAKECVHELGHTFGLRHCGRPGCVMSRSADLFEVDAKGSGLCADCRWRLREGRREEGSEGHERPSQTDPHTGGG